MGWSKAILEEWGPGLVPRGSGWGRRHQVSSVGEGLGKVEVRLKWDPSPFGEPPRHLDIVAATYAADDLHGRPAYVVHYDSRSPDGTINMTRHSQTGLGFGYVEVMVLEFDRLSPAYGRVVVGVVIHQEGGHRTFGEISNAGVLVVRHYTELLADDFAGVGDSTATTVAEFVRDGSGQWEMHEMVQGSDSDPAPFMLEMGSVPWPRTHHASEERPAETA
ncbi:TerD family protein [Streptomyces pseudovenezuelae]|uniref:TerD family protein n=1 Tax=Streptomyces pseudovenezuelae TaxID=67350 RepID=UPI002472EA1C|nr:TerD family protein [Streptomyces pseudovenezuelae]